MTLLEQIKSDQLQARILADKPKASILTTLIGESEMVGKNDGNRDTTDQEVIATIKKFIKNIDETIAVAGPTETLVAEKDALQLYLPRQLTEPELRVTIGNIIVTQGLSGSKAMGQLMGELKKNHAGSYDGGLASKLAKELLV